jgi:hypothetical protein
MSLIPQFQQSARDRPSLVSLVLTVSLCVGTMHITVVHLSSYTVHLGHRNLLYKRVFHLFSCCPPTCSIGVGFDRTIRGWRPSACSSCSNAPLPPPPQHRGVHYGSLLLSCQWIVEEDRREIMRSCSDE